MGRDEWLSALRRDGVAFAETLAGAPMDAPVPGCPDWTAADLWWHLTEVQDFWRFLVAERATSPDAYPDPERPADDELAATYLAGLDELIATLTATPDDVEVWSWTPDHRAGWVVRRMAHEAAAHLGDAQQTAGQDASMDAELASDGIDEFLEFFAGHARQAKPDDPMRGSVHLHCTDVAGEWFVVDGPDGGLTTTREHAKGDCALRGPASDLIFALWRRVPLERVDVVGDAALAARFIDRTRLD